MNDEDIDLVVVLVKRKGIFRWFRSERELWVLDYEKWRRDFRQAGYMVESNSGERFGIDVVDENSIDDFLLKMKDFELEQTKLQNALLARFKDAQSWWDVGKLFPVLFVDGDAKRVAAFYPSGVKLERYVPDGWLSEFEDFATLYPEEALPTSVKFWKKDGLDMLTALIDKAKQAEKPSANHAPSFSSFDPIKIRM